MIASHQRAVVRSEEQWAGEVDGGHGVFETCYGLFGKLTQGSVQDRGILPLHQA